MRVLGLSYGYHDASVAIAEDGRILFAAAEERFSRQKHDPQFPALALREGLKLHNLELSDFDSIVYHEDPFNKFSRVLTSSLSEYPKAHQEFAQSMKAWMGGKLWTLAELAKLNGPRAIPIEYASHHFSHALQAFMGSGFSSAAILIVDAVGDWTCSGLFRAKWVNGKPEIRAVQEIAFPHSLGLVYSAVTSYLGFLPNDSEANTMALAAFGEPTYLAAFEKIVPMEDDGSYRVDTSYFNFVRYYQGAVSKKFIAEFGPPRDLLKTKFNFHSFLPFQKALPDEQHYANIACSLQMLFQNRVQGLAQKLRSDTGETNLCFAGGAALNCVNNSKLASASGFERMFIPLDPGDGGTCIGTALYSSSVGKPEILDRQLTSYSAYLGSIPKITNDLEIVNSLSVENMKKFSTASADELKRWRSLKKIEGLNSNQLIAKVTQLLMNGKIVGWFQGAAEFGPRALGNRSILMRPDDLKLAERLSVSVKKRAGYRPYALSMTEEAAVSILNPDFATKCSHRWMQYIAYVNQSEQKKVRAGLHVDGTTRPQICSESDNLLFFQLLSEFGKQFGVSALLNTSFNPSGYPLVTLPSEALVMFVRTAMDVLVINSTLLIKTEDSL